MKNILKKIVPVLLLAVCAGAANASIITLGSIDKNYGNAASRGDLANTGPGSCDKVNATSITVYDTSMCRRFSDTFDFGHLEYKSIDSLDLTLSFSKTNDSASFIFFRVYEDWRVKIADTSVHASQFTMDMKNSSGLTTQLFHIDAKSHPDVFTNIVSNGKFQLWFGEESILSSNFNLSAASLQINGTPVPEPSSIALFGIAMLGAGAASRARSKKA